MLLAVSLNYAPPERRSEPVALTHYGGDGAAATAESEPASEAPSEACRNNAVALPCLQGEWHGAMKSDVQTMT